MSNSVLVVEDSEELRTLLERTLTERGYEVLCAADVSEAIATLNETLYLCLVFWDATTLPISGHFVALAGSLGVHFATIPIGVSSVGQRPDGTPMIVKRLTSLDAILSILKEYCSGTKAPAKV